PGSGGGVRRQPGGARSLRRAGEKESAPGINQGHRRYRPRNHLEAFMSDQPNRRSAMQCLAFGGAGTLFTLSGGVLMPSALGQTQKSSGVLLFLQISDTHIGFNKDANPDVAGTLKETIAKVNAMPEKPLLTIHTGDITHLSKASEFDT